MNFFSKFTWKKNPVSASDFAEAVRNIPDVVSKIPTAPVRYRFRCIRDFWSKELKSQYVEGGVYSVREGNDKLDLFVKQWVAAGKVRRGA